MGNRLKTQEIRYFEPATVSWRKSRDFPVDSLQSRAAARAILAGLAESQRIAVDSELASLSPFQQAMSQGGQTSLERIWLARLAYLAEERAAVYGTPLPTPEEIWHAREVARIVDELSGGRLSELSSSDPAEEKRSRDLAEKKLRCT